jgi:transposase-like protein
VYLYHRFSVGFRDIEELLGERGVLVTYETVRQWCITVSPVVFAVALAETATSGTWTRTF